MSTLMRDVAIMRDELGALMADLLHAPGSVPVRKIRLSTWVCEARETLGEHNAGELLRHKDRTLA